MGSSGGGSTAGTIGYPQYLENLHHWFLNNDERDSITDDTSVVSAHNAIYGNSPYSGVSAPSPDDCLTAMLAAVVAYNAVVDAIDQEGDWESMIDAAVAKIDEVFLPSSLISARVTAYSARMDDRIENEVLPRFKAGMRDINAVQTSAFVLGQSHIEGMSDRDIADFQAKLELDSHLMRATLADNGVKVMTQILTNRVEGEKNVAALTLEGNRMKIVALAEEAEANLRIDVNDAKWDIESFAYVGNFIAAIGSGTYVPYNEGRGVGSVLGGALSGAAAGGMIGGPTGAAIGGVVGGLGAMFS